MYNVFRAGRSKRFWVTLLDSNKLFLFAACTSTLSRPNRNSTDIQFDTGKDGGGAADC